MSELAASAAELAQYARTTPHTAPAWWERYTKEVIAMTEKEPLPVAGYTPQSDRNIQIVNVHKKAEEAVLRMIDNISVMPEFDKRWLAIARTNIEQGFMALNRAVFQPQRLED
jgi:hypothetical protein